MRKRIDPHVILIALVILAVMIISGGKVKAAEPIKMIESKVSVFKKPVYRLPNGTIMGKERR